MVEAVIIMKIISYFIFGSLFLYMSAHFFYLGYKAVNNIMVIVQASTPQRKYQENMFRY